MPKAVPERGNPAIPTALALVLPGLGHVVLGRRGAGLTFLASIGGMFVTGLALGGQFFPVGGAPPLAMAAGLAEMGIGLPRFAAAALGFGAGDPSGIGYEYGNGFLIAAGLLNLLAALQAWDVANGDE